MSVSGKPRHGRVGLVVVLGVVAVFSVALTRPALAAAGMTPVLVAAKQVPPAHPPRKGLADAKRKTAKKAPIAGADVKKSQQNGVAVQNNTMNKLGRPLITAWLAR